MAFTAPPVWDILILMALILAVLVAGYAGMAMAQDARTQACEKIAAGEEPGFLLPGLVVNCPAEQ